jgi:Na+/melibiose symporter-like transporter
VQAGQILAAAVFLPLAHYMPEEAFNSWGWRIPFLLSFLVVRRRLHHSPRGRRNPCLRRSRQEGRSAKSPIVEAFTDSWADMLRVVCMALMNVIPVVATIFGAAYAVQAAYGIGFQETCTCGFPVLGNILAVLVIPFVGNLSDRIGRKPPIIVGALASGLLSFGYLYAISIQNVPLAIVHVAADVGHRVPGLQRDFPELLPGAVPDPQPRVGHGDFAEHRHAPSPRCCPRCLPPWRRRAPPTSRSRSVRSPSR